MGSLWTDLRGTVKNLFSIKLATLDASGLTAARTFTLPDGGGTLARKFAGTIGDGSSTSIAVTHSLGTKDVTFSVRQNSDDAHVIPDAVSTDTNTLTLTFAVAPTTNALRVTVHG